VSFQPTPKHEILRKA